MGVLLAFARETELCPSGVTLCLEFVVQCCCISLSLCDAQLRFCLYFGVPFPNGMNFELTDRGGEQHEKAEETTEMHTRSLLAN